jgi:2-dehydropantoate 2-reductase
MKIAVLGLGGIGGVVGSCLASKFDNIHFIARGKTLEKIKKDGLKLKSDILGTFSAKPASVTDNPDEIGIVDALIVCTKGYGLESAINQCQNIIGENTVILPLLNGINISSDVKKYTQKGICADGCIYVFANIEEPGVIRQSGNMLKITAGIADGSENNTLKELISMFNKANIPSTYSENILVSAWDKYIMMCGNSLIFCYFDSPAGEIQPYKEKMEFAYNIYKELSLLAKLSGVNIDENTAQKYTDTFLTLPKDTITSLYRDIKTGNPKTEFDSIIGKAYNISHSLNADTPCINAVYKKYRG